MSPSPSPPPLPPLARVWLALPLVVACAFIFLRAMDRDLNHYEHQFLAPAALLAREGLLPYRDYPLFHLPNLVFLYGVLDWLTGRLVLSAKLVAVAATCGVAILARLVAVRRTGAMSPGARWVFGGAVLLLFLSDPLTVFTTGKTWNHELPAFLTVVALLCQLAAAQRDSLPAMAASGLALGLAVGTRLTFAPLLVPCVAFPLLFALPLRRRLAHGAVFLLAALVAGAPSLYFLAADREAFLFGNLEFQRLRLRDPANLRIRQTLTWWRKLRYFGKEIVLPSWPLFAAYALVGVRPALEWLRRRTASALPCALVAAVLPCALLGCFAPSRYQYQHYYLFAPLLVFGVIFGATTELARGPTTRRRQTWIVAAALLAFGTLIFSAVKEDGRAAFDWLGRSAQPKEWFPPKARAIGMAIGARAPAGKVLTLAPAWVLEGGLRIYPEFATGPFAWRSAEFAPLEQRRRLRLIAPADLESLLASDPPAAILTGVEDERWEKPLVAWAEAHGYRPEKLSKSRVLWLP